MSADLTWFFSEGQTVCERSPFGNQLDLAARYAAPMATPGLRAGTCTHCNGSGEVDGAPCQYCEGTGRSNPAYPSGETFEAHGRIGDDTSLIRYAQISRNLLAMRPRALVDALVAIYGGEGDRWVRRMRPRWWAVTGICEGSMGRSADDWDHIAQLEDITSDAERSAELATVQESAMSMVRRAQDEWKRVKG